MNAARLTLAAAWVLVAVLLIVQPWFTRRNVLFGVVFGNDEVWRDRAAERIRLRYLRAMVSGTIVIGVLCGLYFLLAKPGEGAVIVAYLIGIAALLIFGTAVFIVFHAQTRAFKAARGTDAELVSERVSVETSLSDRQTVISPAWLLLLLPVLLAAYGVAILGYPAMPAQIPVHYSYTAVDAWAPKSWRMVLLPLLTGTLLTAFLFVCCLFTRRAPASVRGNPEAAPKAFRFRKYMIVLMITLSVLAELSFLLIEVGFLLPVSPLWFNIPSILSLALTAVIFYVYFRFVRVKKPRGPILDDDAKWVLGMFYYNPSDPSFLIEKRTGIGYTLNFAKPAAWILLLGIVAVVVGTLVASIHPS